MKDLVLKVCVTGEGGTGKTTLLHRLISGEFIANMKMTIGTGLMTHNVLINGEDDDYNITYQLWDFAGEKRFRFFLPNYLKGSSAVFMCFDLSRYPTFKNLEEWYKIVTETSKPP
ncbi:MAG: GTP-binding protein, partial [archaeon]|nr:GTP-binding protein [archaeon]